jgi:hypothetical protein
MKNEFSPFQQHRPLETITDGKPDLPKRLFWEFVYEDIDWLNDYRTVIQRVIERGNDEAWTELFRYYGYDKVLYTLKFESTYLMDHTIEKVCAYFQIKPEELRCYTRKQLRGGHWI